MPAPESVVIVGASLAGTRCAAALRRAGFDGRISLIGSEAERPYDRPPLSKQYLAGEWNRPRLALIGDEDWSDLGLDTRLGVAGAALRVDDRVVVLDDGSEVSGDAVVIATGARPRLLPGTEGLEGVHTLRTLDDADGIRADLGSSSRKVLVVGAGFIGAEVAATAVAAGHDVTIVEMAPTPLRRALGERLGSVCGSLHADHGVELLLGTTVATWTAESGRVSSVRLDSGAYLEVDVAVVGIGVQPNTDWLADSGLELDDGVVCDEFSQAAPGIWAAGDVARWPNPRFGEMMRVEHWENAIDHGNYVADRILGREDEPYQPVPWFWSDQYEHKIQLAGRPADGDAIEIVTGSIDERRFAAIYGRGDRLTGVFGLNRPRHVMQYRRLITEGATWPDALAFAEEARSK